MDYITRTQLEAIENNTRLARESIERQERTRSGIGGNPGPIFSKETKICFLLFMLVGGMIVMPLTIGTIMISMVILMETPGFAGETMIEGMADYGVIAFGLGILVAIVLYTILIFLLVLLHKTLRKKY